MKFAITSGRICSLAAMCFLLWERPVAAAAAGPHYVFAHYMVCFATYGDFGNDTNSTIAGYKRDIRDAQAAGIDGFALNVGAYNDPTQMYYNTRIAEIYEAAEQLGTGFKLFFSVDCGGESNIVNMVETYARRTNSFTYHGKPVLSAYGWNNVASQGWPGLNWTNAIIGKLAKDGYPVFFVPFFFADPVREIPEYGSAVEVAAQYTNLVNGLFCWTAAGLPAQMAVANSNYIQVVRGAGKVIMAGLEPHYWGSIQPSLGRRYYETSGGEGLITQWLSIITNQPDWLEICTWNDFNESTYISPVYNPETYFAQLQVPHRYSHQGYLELSKWFIAWYKTGIPPTNAPDALFYFYRSHPENAVASDTNDIPVTWVYGNAQDTIFTTVFSTGPAQLVIDSGGKVTTNLLTTGIQSVETPFKPGTQDLTVIRNGQVVLSVEGPPILSAITNYDFFPASGYTYGISNVVSSPVNLRINGS
jgi:glucan endo-1,3-alpha-glucosidase